MLRTVHSVINRSPTELLKEVILVDDFSSKGMLMQVLFNLIWCDLILEFSKKPLDDYVKEYFNKVYVIHLPERMGLIRARLAGAKEATADVLLFLDSHTEANVNWLPPLLGKNILFTKYV